VVGTVQKGQSRIQSAEVTMLNKSVIERNRYAVGCRHFLILSV